MGGIVIGQAQIPNLTNLKVWCGAFNEVVHRHTINLEADMFVDEIRFAVSGKLEV